MTPREIDALVAEKVMGWQKKGLVHWVLDGKVVTDFPPYSTDIAAAWEVVEKLNFVFGIFSILPSGYACAISDPKEKEAVSGEADTAPMAGDHRG